MKNTKHFQIALQYIFYKVESPKKLSAQEKEYVRGGLLDIAKGLSEYSGSSLIYMSVEESLKNTTRKQKVLFKKVIKDLQGFLVALENE